MAACGTTLQIPTESGHTALLFWSNLPDFINAEQIADFYRRRRSIEGMSQRLESVLVSEIETLTTPRQPCSGSHVSPDGAQGR